MASGNSVSHAMKSQQGSALISRAEVERALREQGFSDFHLVKGIVVGGDSAVGYTVSVTNDDGSSGKSYSAVRGYPGNAVFGVNTEIWLKIPPGKNKVPEIFAPGGAGSGGGNVLIYGAMEYVYT